MRQPPWTLFLLIGLIAAEMVAFNFFKNKMPALFHGGFTYFFQKLNHIAKMPRASVIAKSYAKALFAAANKNGSVDKISLELEIFKQNFSTSFAHELKNPVISKDDLVKIIQEVTQKFNLSVLTSNFFSSIVRNRRLNLFPEIYEEFARLLRDQKNILEVEVITAIKSEKNQIESVKALVAKKYPGKVISIKEKIEEKILGGLKIKINSEIIDISLKNQFANLGKDLLSAVN